MTLSRALIVGASAAGLSAAEGLPAHGYSGEVTLVGEEAGLPYDRPPLSKRFLEGRWEADQLTLCDADRLAAAGIDYRPGTRAVGLDLAGRTVRTASGDELPFSDLVIATGARPRMPEAWRAIPGVFCLRTLADACALREKLTTARRVVVVGAGFIGAEAAASIVRDDRPVMLVDPLPLPMASVLPEQVAQLLHRTHAARGVDVRCGVGVATLRPENDVVRVELSDGTATTADVVIVGLGAQPNVEWLTGSGLQIDGGVLCDAYCRAADHVYAAGDVASWPNPRYGVRMRVEHRLHASDQAGYVAQSIAGAVAVAPYAPIPFFWSDQFDIRLQAFGHIRPSDVFTVIEGELDSGRFVGTCTRDGNVVGVLGASMPKQTRAARSLIADAAV